MNSPVAYCFIAFTFVLIFNIIFPVDGQCTVKGCETDDSPNNCVAQMRELNSQLDTIMTRLEAVDRRSLGQDASLQQLKTQHDSAATRLEAFERRSQEQDIYTRQVLSASLQQMKTQQDTVLAILQAVDQRSQDQAQSNHEFLNVSFQEMKNEQHIAKTRLEAVDRRSKEQFQSIREFLNASFPQLKDDQDRVKTSLPEKLERLYEVFNASFQRIENRHDTVDTNLEAVAQSIKNQTQISWRLATACGIDDWIVIMNRFDGSESFYRNWNEYRNGFGDKGRGEFWLGNEQVHRLTNRFVYTLRVEIQLNSSGERYYAEYSSFSLDSERNKYNLHLSGYSGNAGDAFTNTSLDSTVYLGGMNFTTWDDDNDRASSYNCAQSYSGGYWFNICGSGCLTCSYRSTFYWHWHGGWHTFGILRAARMMIRSA